MSTLEAKSRSGQQVVAAAIALALLAGGCATPGLPDARATSSLTLQVLERTQRLYLYPERLDRRMLVGALDALERRFDSVRFVEDGTEGLLMVGAEKANVPLEGSFDPAGVDEVLGRALHFVEANLPDDLDLQPGSTLELISLRGALQSLDRYSTIYSGRGTEDFQIRFSGKLHGIGSTIGRRDGQLSAIRVFPDSPAQRGGLEDGDAILYIDSEPTRPLTVRQAVDRIRGESGTLVRLGVLRDEVQLDIEITRGEVIIPSVETEDLGDRIGYARVTQVARNTTAEFQKKVLALGDISGLVLDLRRNSGGSMVAATLLADLFLTEDLIVRVVDRNTSASGGHSQAMARPEAAFSFPVVVLVDRHTASAAEILAGAIAPLERVTIVGQTTFGKGVIQRVMNLPDENLLKLTVGEYLLSGDRAIHEKGINPDIELKPVSTADLGALADLPPNALAYVRKTGGRDDFPMDLAKALLTQDRAEAMARMRRLADEGIREQLLPLGVSWPADDPLPEGELALPIEIESEPVEFTGGSVVSLPIRVTNPNQIMLPDAWASLHGSVEYLRNAAIPLGTIAAGGTATGKFELHPGDGLAASPLQVTVRVASGSRALEALPLSVIVKNHPPRVQIDVERLPEDQASVTLTNLGCCSPGQIRISVTGATRALEAVESGASSSVELPISGNAKEISILLYGGGVRRQIQIPIPEHRISVTPPELTVERGSWLGGQRIQVRAKAAEGLREGWLQLDGQKETYVDWNGDRTGTLRAPITAGEHKLVAKVETMSGVSVIDLRTLTVD